MPPAPLEADTDTRAPSPWHAGELTLQASAGVEERMDETGRKVIRDHFIPQHRDFFPLLPFVVMGTVDGRGDAWATVQEGPSGFLDIPDPRTMRVGGRLPRTDPASAGLMPGAGVGVLGIQLETRRRNRMNGRIRTIDDGGIELAVEQSYGNCPKYIRIRDQIPMGDAVRPERVAFEGSTLQPAMADFIDRADTFFVASYSEDDGNRHVDVSHRGGKPGFVRVDGDGSLTIPDFAGNSFFNTLGNIASNGRAGLCFPDFATGTMFQMTGAATILLDSAETALFPGAERLWRFTPHRAVVREHALAQTWSTTELALSPEALPTGTWKARKTADDPLWRPHRIVGKIEESASVTSFYLVPDDGGKIAPFDEGQYLPVRVGGQAGSPAMIRTYTISSGSEAEAYRLSIKRKGAVSSHFHDQLEIGGLVEARQPAGGFRLPSALSRPVVMLAAGIGVTPVLAMLERLACLGKAGGALADCWVFYGARDLSDRPFDSEIAGLMERLGGRSRYVRLLSQPGNATVSVDYERSGRLTVRTLQQYLPFGDYDFYLCGPPGFMQDLYDGLRSLNVADDRINAEAFGPASLRREPSGSPGLPASAKPVVVSFSRSGVVATWRPGSGTLRDLAERSGLQPDFSCRSGNCGTCRARVTEGVVSHAEAASFAVDADQCLPCCAAPAAGCDSISLDL